MSFAWRLRVLKQKRCKRCGLYYAKSLKQCNHCSAFNDDQLAAFKEQHQQKQEGNNIIGVCFFFIVLIITLLLLSSFFY